VIQKIHSETIESICFIDVNCLDVFNLGADLQNPSPAVKSYRIDWETFECAKPECAK
jgi:hypothetical protein